MWERLRSWWYVASWLVRFLVMPRRTTKAFLANVQRLQALMDDPDVRAGWVRERTREVMRDWTADDYRRFAAHAVSPHTCQCRACHPDLFPNHVQPIREGHISIRWDNGPVRPDVPHITVDGVEVRRCHEALPGSDGYVLLWSQPAHICPCGGHYACETVLRGDVRVAIVPGRISTDAGPLD